jgi:LysM repeat protein
VVPPIATATADSLAGAPPATGEATAEPAATPETTPVVTPTAEPPSQPTYVVGPGDTLGQIAQNLGINIIELARINDITTEALLFPGDVLLLPFPDQDPTATAVSGDLTPPAN